MKPNIQYEPPNEKYAPQAMNLVIAAYNEEKQSVPYLPGGEDFFDLLDKLIRNLFKQGSGVAASLVGSGL